MAMHYSKLMVFVLIRSLSVSIGGLRKKNRREKESMEMLNKNVVIYAVALLNSKYKLYNSVMCYYSVFSYIHTCLLQYNN